MDKNIKYTLQLDGNPIGEYKTKEQAITAFKKIKKNREKVEGSGEFGDIQQSYESWNYEIIETTEEITIKTKTKQVAYVPQDGKRNIVGLL